MENILFKKSYLLSNFKEIKYNDLWNKKGIFTTIRVIGRPYCLYLFDQHLKNLNYSLKKFGINASLSKRKICKIINNLFNKKTTYDHLFRIAINSNILSVSLRVRPKPKKKFFASIVSYRRPDYKYKNLNYRKILNYISTINTTSKEILLVKKNCLLEGCTTNLLFIKKNKIYIPKEGYYPGVTLKFFLKRIKGLVVRKNIHINQLKDFEEIILLGTGKGVVSLNEIKDLNWKRKRNIYYKKLLNLYNKSL